MSLIKKPEGYVSAFASHTDPAYSNLPIKLSQVKQEETLLGANLKSFIKERLFGNFINYKKVYNSRKYNYTPPVSSLAELKDASVDYDIKKSAPTIRENYKHRINDLRTAIQKKIHARYRHKDEKNEAKHRFSHRNSLEGNIQEPAILNQHRKRVNRSNLAHRNSMNGSRLDRNHSFDLQKLRGASFISAIDDSQKQSSKIQHSGRKERLSPLNNKAELISKLEKVKNNLIPSNKHIKKGLNRKQTEKFAIIDSIWEFFCQPSKGKASEKLPVLTNNSKISKDQKNNQSSISSIPKIIDTRILEINRSSLFIDKSKFSLPRAHFLKESFSQYLNNLSQTYPPLSNFYNSFFEINSKIYDELKIEEYKHIVENLVNSSPRVWAVSSFRFWDVNQDGVICSKDIFAMYQTLDAEQAKLKLTQNGENCEGYKTILELKSILESLRKTIIEVNFDLQVRKKLKVKSKPSDQDIYEIKYLEQSLLRKKQLKYSDLILVLGHNIKASTKDVKKMVIDTAKQLSVKFLSCYRFSFVATDHNQQTRSERQYIENLKQLLRKQKIELNQKQEEQIQNTKIQGINYKAYYQKQIFLKIKPLVMESFGIQLQ